MKPQIYPLVSTVLMLNPESWNWASVPAPAEEPIPSIEEVRHD
jgi:hypothetical protein